MLGLEPRVFIAVRTFRLKNGKLVYVKPRTPYYFKCYKTRGNIMGSASVVVVFSTKSFIGY